MSNITNTRVYGLSESIISSGYPMQKKTLGELDFKDKVFEIINLMNANSIINKDINRAQRLFQMKDNSHSSFSKGIIVQFDWRTPIFMQPQIQRYHFIDIVSSQSAMHKLMDRKEFKQDDFAGVINHLDTLNELLEMYKDETDADAKRDLWELLLNDLPQSYLKTARYTTNLLQLKTMHSQRRHHKLQQWQEFCDWIEGLDAWRLLNEK